MKEGKNLCLNVNDLRALARVNEITLKLKEMERILKIRKDENNEKEKKRKLERNLKKLINERYGFKKS